MACIKIKMIDNVQVYNEFEQYVDSRYLSAGEAIWKIYGLPVFQMSHAVYALPVHLENYQRVIFDPDKPEKALHRAESQLTAFFKLNQRDAEARQYLYTDIPYHYVYDKKKQSWKIRERREVVTRVHIVSYNNIELYSLRLLLYVVKGPQSFEDIRRVNGVQYDTFREAAIALGLLEDDSQHIETFKEIIHVETPYQIRCLFASMMVFWTPSDPLYIWNEFKKSMYDDYIRKQCSVELAENLALRHISYQLKWHNKTNTNFGLPEPDLSADNLIEVEQRNISIDNSRTFDVLQEERDGNTLSSMLYADQRCVYDAIMSSVDDESDQRLFFVDGPAGTGKTFFASALITSIRGKGKNVLPVAWTGIAASLMKGGRTATSAFKLPLNMFGKVACNISTNSDVANELRKLDVIVWDEISMTPCHAIDSVDAFFRDLMQNDLPFGGKVFVATGDFRQILPIVKGGSKCDLLAALVKNSKIWPQMQKYALTVNKRLSSIDAAFARWQLDIGEGKLKDYPPNEYYSNFVKIPKECLEPNCIVERIYGKTFNSRDINNYLNTAIITTLNEDVNSLNDSIMNRMKEDVSTERSFYSLDKVVGIEADDDDSYDVTMLNSLSVPNFPPHALKLKENCIIMLLRNINPSQGLSNGTRLLVTKLYQTCIRARILSGDFAGTETLLSRCRMTADVIDASGELERIQIPVRLAFAMTINKSQGQTFDIVGAYFRKPVFSHGQAYVAFSRGRSKQNLIVQVLPGAFMGKIKPNSEDVFVPNVVYKEALS